MKGTIMRLTPRFPHLALHRARALQAFRRRGGWQVAAFPLPTALPPTRRAGRGSTW